MHGLKQPPSWSCSLFMKKKKNKGFHLQHDTTGQALSRVFHIFCPVDSLQPPYEIHTFPLSSSSTAETVEGQGRWNTLPKITQLINGCAQLQTQASGACADCPELGVEKEGLYSLISCHSIHPCIPMPENLPKTQLSLSPFCLLRK